MVSARSLLTTCDRVNMRFYRLNLSFCVNYDSNYNSTLNLKQAILTKSFCCVPYHVSVPVLKQQRVIFGVNYLHVAAGFKLI